MIAEKHTGQGAKPARGEAMPIAYAIMPSGNPAAQCEYDTMTQATLNAAASLAAIATATPGEALAAFDGRDDLAVASDAAEAAKGMAVCLSEADNAVSGYAKAYGQARAVLQFARSFDGDGISANDKRAIGFDELPSNSSAKRRLSQWHSRFRLIAERRTRPADAASDDKRYVSDEQLAGLYGGAVSFLTVYDNLVAADRAHKAATAKAAKETEAAATVTATEAAPASLADMALALAAALDAASDDERAAAGEAIAMLLDTVNGIYNVETVETEQRAAA
jgi:hypothetical protein